MAVGNSEDEIERPRHQRPHAGDYDSRDFNDLKDDFEEWKKIITRLAQQVHGDGDREAMDKSLQTRVREQEKFIKKLITILTWFGAAIASLAIHAAWRIFTQK